MWSSESTKPPKLVVVAVAAQKPTHPYPHHPPEVEVGTEFRATTRKRRKTVFMGLFHICLCVLAEQSSRAGGWGTFVSEFLHMSNSTGIQQECDVT